MSELDEKPQSYSGALIAAVAVALLAALGGLIWSYMLSSRLGVQEAALANPLVQRAKEIFKAEVRSVVDLRQA